MKLLIVMRDEYEWSHDLTKEHEELIRRRFPELDLVVARGEASPEDIMSADAFAGFPVRIPAVEDGMKVRWVHSFSAGVDKVLTPNVKANEEIIVSNSSGIHATPISEYIIGGIIAYNKNFLSLLVNKSNKRWQGKIPARELSNSTVIVYGLGEIGSATARLLKGFGCSVYGVVRTMREEPEYVDGLYTTETVREKLSDADYIVSTLPGSTETIGFFNKSFFESCKPEAVFVNIGRGTVVNQDDLIEALTKGTIEGAVLDVTTPEPLPMESPLWEMENVIITPHTSGSSPYSMDRIIDRLCLNIEAYCKNETLPNQVNKELGY